MRAQLVLENVGVHLPNRVLFQKVNWSLYEGMRVALAGRNGSGKSTLLRILSGKLDPTDGRCNIVGKRNLKIGYLDQSLLDSAVLETKQLKDQSMTPVAYIEGKLKASAGEDHHEETEWKIRKTLAGLGFTDENLDSPMNRLSGGWLLRMFIAATLLDEPDVLLLDEPTNHLDISSIQWLEEFLEKDFKGSLVLVTHDVSLQKRTTDSLAILHGGNFYFRTHQRDYLTFRESLEDERRILEKNLEAMAKKIDELQEFVYKFRAKVNLASRAQSKAKEVEDMEAERRLLKDRLARIQGFHYNLHFRFRMSSAGSKFPLVAKHASFRYGGEQSPWILKGATLDVSRGQRIAIIGDNGAGKTTFLNLLAGCLKPQSGEITPGYGVDLGYFGQHQLDELQLDATVVDNLRAKAPNLGVEQVRGYLGAFGFHGDEDVLKKARVLSGGERARLALLRILVTPVNVILLDEPTNHLDIETKELLKEAIRSYEGTILLVSHDRDFIASIADRIVYLSVDHKMTDHIGNLDSFFEKYPQFVRHVEGAVKLAPAKAVAAPAPKQLGSTLSFEERKKLRNRLKSLERNVEAAEAKMADLTKEKESLDAETNRPNFYDAANAAKREAVLARIAALDQELHARMVEWERWGTELEKLKSEAPE